jgi:hypothetical protein
MKFLIASAMIALLYSGFGIAQVQGDKPTTTEPPGMTLVTGNESKHASEADARHCLGLKDNLAIIRCAEKYRRASASKTGGT